MLYPLSYEGLRQRRVGRTTQLSVDPSARCGIGPVQWGAGERRGVLAHAPDVRGRPAAGLICRAAVAVAVVLVSRFASAAGDAGGKSDGQQQGGDACAIMG